ncbi:hypothetical protein BH11PSE11_BH11PSE11_31900 [soil metagenome]
MTITNRSKQVALSKVIPGMVLSDDLIDDQGKILLPQGATITDAIITSLGRHNVAILPILCEALSSEEEAAEASRHKARLDRLFRKHAGGASTDEATELMRQYVTRFRTGAGA